MVEFVDSNVEGIPPLCRVIPMIRLPLIKTELDNTTRLENELTNPNFEPTQERDSEINTHKPG